MDAMHRHSRWIVAAAALAAMLTGSLADDGQFESLSVYLERNVQDNDAEVRFEVTGAQDGLAVLNVSAPGERTVIEFRTPASKLGIRKLTIESPEPNDPGVVRADFPAGTYRFEGKTTGGANLRGEARLGHAFPKPAAFEYPRPGQKDLPATALTLRWSLPERVESCVIVVEQSASPYEIRALLPGSTTAFTIPNGFLRAGQAYKFAIGTVATDGNRSFIEGGFATAKAKPAPTEKRQIGPRRTGHVLPSVQERRGTSTSSRSSIKRGSEAR